MRTKKTVSVIMYFIPAAITVICDLIAVEALGFSSVHPAAWLITLMLVISAFLMYQNRWWGCLFGIAVGISLINNATADKGPMTYEIPIAIPICVYYLICGIICCKMKDKN